MPKPLLVVGSVNADLYVEIDRLPAPGETLDGSNAAMRPGGKGANQAAAAARLGQATWFAGQLGTDAFASALRVALGDAGVKLDHLAMVEGPTGQAFILLQRGGENSIIIVGGANQRWGQIPGALASRIASAGAVLLQREIPDEVNLLVARLAKTANVPVVMDVGGADRPLSPELLGLVAVLSPNESELARLTGMATSTRDEVVTAARSLMRSGVATVLVKLGKRGALLVSAANEPIEHPAFPVSVVDTTGAGDCFTAAYTVALLEGQSERNRLGFACSAAALCIQKKGAMPSMPLRSEVEQFQSRHQR
ncbi:MAG: ribokinase [Planctomycetes bacterium]|nr:ribokinase [Planctomycetota bacterium]